jgi:hypothetical protein
LCFVVQEELSIGTKNRVSRVTAWVALLVSMDELLKQHAQECRSSASKRLVLVWVLLQCLCIGMLVMERVVPWPYLPHAVLVIPNNIRMSLYATVGLSVTSVILTSCIGGAM